MEQIIINCDVCGLAPGQMYVYTYGSKKDVVGRLGMVICDGCVDRCLKNHSQRIILAGIVGTVVGIVLGLWGWIGDIVLLKAIGIIGVFIFSIAIIIGLISKSDYQKYSNKRRGENAAIILSGKKISRSHYNIEKFWDSNDFDKELAGNPELAMKLLESTAQTKKKTEIKLYRQLFPPVKSSEAKKVSIRKEMTPDEYGDDSQLGILKKQILNLLNQPHVVASGMGFKRTDLVMALEQLGFNRDFDKDFHSFYDLVSNALNELVQEGRLQKDNVWYRAVQNRKE